MVALLSSVLGTSAQSSKTHDEAYVPLGRCIHGARKYVKVSILKYEGYVHDPMCLVTVIKYIRILRVTLQTGDGHHFIIHSYCTMAYAM